MYALVVLLIPRRFFFAYFSMTCFRILLLPPKWVWHITCYQEDDWSTWTTSGVELRRFNLVCHHILESFFSFPEASTLPLLLVTFLHGVILSLSSWRVTDPIVSFGRTICFKWYCWHEIEGIYCLYFWVNKEALKIIFFTLRSFDVTSTGFRRIPDARLTPNRCFSPK